MTGEERREDERRGKGRRGEDKRLEGRRKQRSLYRATERERERG